MIEGYTTGGDLVLLNPRYVLAVFTGGTRERGIHTPSVGGWYLNQALHVISPQTG